MTLDIFNIRSSLLTPLFASLNSALFLISPCVVSAQSLTEVKSNPDLYIYGEATGGTEAEADRLALDDLLSKISTHVVSSTSMTSAETTTDGKIQSSNTEFSSMVKTYRGGQLTNTNKDVTGDEPDVHVVRWMKRSDVTRIFEARKQRVIALIDEALEAETKGQLDVMIRDMYWALLLTKTLQFPGEMQYTLPDERRQFVETWIPNRLKELFKEIKVTTVARNDTEVELLFEYKNRKVESIDYTYYDGINWTKAYSTANGGLGVMEVDDNYTPTDYKIRIEYAYPHMMGDIADVELAYNAQDHKPKVIGRELAFTSAPVRLSAIEDASRRKLQREAEYKAKISGLSPSATATSPVVESFSSIDPSVYAKPQAVVGDSIMDRRMSDIISSITSKRYDAVRPYFTSEGWSAYERLIKYGKASVIGNRSTTMYRHGDHTMIRGLHMNFKFDSGTRRSFTEEIIFSVNDSGLVDNIAFGLGKTAEDDILGNSQWPEAVRFALLEFMENYKTAYSLRNIDYISKVFSDDALIITGSVLKPAGRKVNSGDYSGLSFGEEQVRYNRYNKREYINHLRQSFAGKSFINVQFAKNRAYKLNDPHRYAIQIVQDYFSSNYSDHGYLMLMIDMADESNPLITFRSWSPYENDPHFDPGNWR